jgi:hypothetical protein
MGHPASSSLVGRGSAARMRTIRPPEGWRLFFRDDQKAVRARQRSQVARALPGTSATSGSCPAGGLKLQEAGRKRVRPGLARLSVSAARRARAKRGPRSRLPASAPSTGAAKSRNVTAEETGLPGRPKKGFVTEPVAAAARQFPEDQRLAGLDAHAGEVEARACAGQRRLHQVEFARRDAAGDEQHVRLCGLGQRTCQRFGVVIRGRGQHPGLAAGSGNHGCQHGRVRVADLAGAGEDSTGRAHRLWQEWPRAAADKHVEQRASACRGERDLREGDCGPGGEQFVALARLRALGNNVFAFSQLALGSSRTRPFDTSTCSIITTASAPAGTGAPVMISHAAPFGSGPAGASPARVAPAMAEIVRRKPRQPGRQIHRAWSGQRAADR